MRGKVVIGAAVARRPRIGGHTWMALQWLLGFKAIGWDALLLDWLEPDGVGGRGGQTGAIGYLAAAMEQVGLGDSWAVATPGREPVGPARDALLGPNASCDLMINVMGYVPADLAPRATVSAFLDIDPGFGQMWRELGLADIFSGHDQFLTVGTNIAGCDCGIPRAGLQWIPTLPPVALGEWPVAGEGANVTSVVSWRGPFDAIEYGGARYGLRVHEFRNFMELPALSGIRPKLALDIDPADADDRERLLAHGWDLVDPLAVAGDPVSYREFVGGSALELSVAKEMYVATRGGWFSDRSACYLASGKPVVAQDTGFGALLPTGDGLLPFSTVEEAAAGLAEALGNRRHHQLAARALAEEYLSGDRVIGKLLDRIGGRS